MRDICELCWTEIEDGDVIARDPDNELVHEECLAYHETQEKEG